MHRLIGLCGYAHNGKSLAAKYLFDKHEFINVKFAETLKDMLRSLGLDHRHIEGELKEVPCELLSGKTPRHAMRTLGAEWGRDQMDPNFWVNIWRHKANTRLIRGINVVCDDVRYENEVAAIKEMGGVIWRIDRGIVPDNIEHSSERPDLLDVDAVVRNKGNKADLYKTLEALLFH